MTETSSILDTAFDTANEEGSPDFPPLPKGSYPAGIKDCNVAKLKSGKGQAILATWEIAEGEYAGRLVWDRIIITHESAEAMKFGRRKLKDIAEACGVKDSITDLSVICHKPCLVFVKIEEDENSEYPPKNRVTRVKPIGAAKPAKANGDGKPFDDEITF